MIISVAVHGFMSTKMTTEIFSEFVFTFSVYFRLGVSNLRPMGRKQPKLAMNAAQDKIINLHKNVNKKKKCYVKMRFTL